MKRWAPVTAFVPALAVMISGWIIPPAMSAELVIAVKEPQISVDPHYSTQAANVQTNIPVFEPMLRIDKTLRLQPRLAESWKVLDDKTWVFTLRKNVKWHDGSPFTAADVIYSLKRPLNLQSPVNTFRSYVAQIATTEALDDHTVKIITTEPASMLGHYLSNVAIVQKRTSENATTDDFNSGKAAIGTGPYKFVSWVLNDKTVLEKNKDYWGPIEPWDKVTYRFVVTDASRVAALLAGDVDVATVTADDIDRIKSKVSVTSKTTMRLTFLTLDASPEALNSGKVTGPNGEKLETNPLADIRVRKAMKLSVDLDALVSKLLNGQAHASGQIVPKGIPGYNNDIPIWKSDLQEARRLLNESGWANKFKVTISVATNQVQGGPKAAEAIAQTWTRIGIPTSVTSMPFTVFTAERAKNLHPINIAAATNTLGDPERTFTGIAVTRRMNLGLGQNNYANYSNPKLDALVETGSQTIDPDKHAAIFVQAAKVLDEDVVVIPLWFENATAGTKPGIEAELDMNGLIFPTAVKPVKK